MALNTVIGAAVASALALGIVAPATSSTSTTPSPDVIVIDELGARDVPAQWFADAVVVPGDSAERTIFIENRRPDTTTVSVAVTGVDAPRDETLLADLRLHWGDASATVADVAVIAPVLADRVALAPGERLPVSLGYDYSHDATRIPSDRQTLTFTISITATAPSGGAGDGAGDGAGGGLATTGGEGGEWWLLALLSVLAGWWLLATRRRPREDDAVEI